MSYNSAMAQYTIALTTGQTIPTEEAPTVRNSCLFASGVYFPLASVLMFGYTDQVTQLLAKAAPAAPAAAPYQRSTNRPANTAGNNSTGDSRTYLALGTHPAAGKVCLRLTQWGYKIHAEKGPDGQALWIPLPDSLKPEHVTPASAFPLVDHRIQNGSPKRTYSSRN